MNAEEQRIRLIEDQQRYEAEAVERGVRRYQEELRRARKDGTEADTGPGQRMMTAIMTEVVPHVESMQERALQYKTNAPAWQLPILSLSAEKWSYIAARTALSHARAERSANNLALTIASRGQEERQLELFLEKARKDRKAARKEGKDLPTGMRLALERIRNMPPRQVRSILRRMQEAQSLGWTLVRRTHVGWLLVNALVEHGGGWFESTMVTTSKAGRVLREVRVRLTSVAVEYLDHHHAQSELTRPWKLPMLCPPNPWRME